jgi:hypothetical protein
MNRSAAIFPLVALLGISASLLADDGRDSKAAAVTGALGGAWKGTLEYRDYSSDKRVTLPTTLEAVPSEDGRSITLKFRYDEGKGRFVEGSNLLKIDPDRSKLSWESDGGKSTYEYTIAGLDDFARKPGGDLVLSGTGVENEVKVGIRQTITVDGENLTILRESKKPGGEFAFRNAYRMRKEPAAK